MYIGWGSMRMVERCIGQVVNWMWEGLPLKLQDMT